MRSDALRIGLSGAPGVGKTTLARALGAALGVPVLDEEMRAHLEATRRPLAGLPSDEIERVLHALWRERAAREQAEPAFVADNSCLDFAAYGVYYDCLAAPAPGEPEPALLREPRAYLARYDAIIMLPCGALPYVRDGVRPDSRPAQLRHQLIIDGLARRYVEPSKLHHLPEACTQLADRVAWVRGVVEPARRGTVYLVGAGPGDPGLLTVRARALLADADVVAYDALVPPAILALARPSAELVAVGRRHGNGPTPYRLHPAVIAHALAGRRVVRLKAGDPLIFGRGGEEAAELRDAGVAFELVPGVSAALGAAAYAGIPLTHRDHASDVTFASGHDVDGSHPSHTAWASAARGTGTLVLFMAARTLAANLARLIAAGRAPTTPAAYVAAATTPAQQVFTGTLATLAEQARDADPAAPALVIVGDVVGLRDRLAWFSPAGAMETTTAASPTTPAASPTTPSTTEAAQPARTLAGRRILVGRARPGPSALAAALRARGAEVVETPVIDVAPLDDTAALDARLARFSDVGAIAFGCAAGVDAVLAAVARLGGTLGRPILAIGAPAAAALERAGVAITARIRGACRDALAEHAALFARGPLLVITGETGRDGLCADLAALGATVEPVVAYRQTVEPAAFEPAGLQLVVLPSSTAAHAVLTGPHGDVLRALPAIVIGPRTEAAARAAGATRVRCAARDDIAALIEAVERAAPPATRAAAAPTKPVHGLVVVYTGQGKGKTTAALGMVFRALGRGLRVAVVQFIKGKWKTGERMYAETVPELTFLVMGQGFTWNSDDLSRDRAAAEAAWATAKQLITSGAHAIVVADELTFAINYGFVELDDVLATLRDRPPHVHVVITGRNAPAPLCALADLVTDMAAVKHPFARGVTAQLGVDY